MSIKPATGADAELEWIKSSYSGADTPSCVEIAATSASILIRDSKKPTGRRLALTPAAWAAFLPYAAKR